MDRVILKKSQLLEVVKKNRETHIDDYKDALSGFKEQRKKILTKMAEKADRGEEEIDISPLWNLRKPDSHQKDYDRVISMLTHHVGETVELSNDDFGRYFQDEWDWKEGWTTSNSIYSAKIASKRIR